MDRIDEKVSVAPDGEDWLSPSEILLHWDTRHLVTTGTQRVDIKLYGYTESHDVS